MKTWVIKHNDYPISERKGRNEAVEALKRHMDWEGHSIIEQVWNVRPHRVDVIITNGYDRYSIEEAPNGAI